MGMYPPTQLLTTVVRSWVSGYVVRDEDDVNIRSPIMLNDGENYIPGNPSAPGSDHSLKERLPPLLPSWCMES